MTDTNSTSPTLPWKTRLSVNFFVAATDFCRRSDGTINRTLLKFLNLSKVGPKSSKTVSVSDITVDSTRGLWFRLYVPAEAPTASKLPLLVYFPGGGFSFFSPDLKPYDQMCRRFAESFQAVVVSVNYRLAPEHKFPAQYDDGFDVLKFLDQRSFAEFPAAVDLSRCFVAGDSAGGNLAHNIVCRYAEAEESCFTELKIIGLIAMQPFFGGEERTESEIRLQGGLSVNRSDWHWKAFLPEGEDRDHPAVNVFGPRSNDISGLKKFPDALVFVGGMDPLQDWQRRYYGGLKRSEKKAKLVEYPNAIHAFYVFPELVEASFLVKEVGDFIRNNGNVKN